MRTCIAYALTLDFQTRFVVSVSDLHPEALPRGELGWTVDMSTPLLPEVIPEIDVTVNPMTFCGQVGEKGGKCKRVGEVICQNGLLNF